MYVLEISYLRIILETEGLSHYSVLVSLAILPTLIDRIRLPWQGLLICELLTIAGAEAEFMDVQFR
jgi:hypothetical protein